MTDRRRFLQAAGAALAASSLGGCGAADKAPTPGVPRSRFDEDSTAEEVTAGIDLSGKMAVVTGCTSGIGFETMRVLALRGAHVVGTTRSIARAFGKDGICAFVLAPGFIRTDMAQAFIDDYGEEHVVSDLALNRLTEPDDLAPLAVLLASGLADHATGGTFDLNAGSYVH